MTRRPPDHTSCWEVAHLLRDDAAQDRARRSTDRLLHLAAGLPPESHLTWVMAGDGVGGVRLTVHTDAAQADIPGLLLWVGEGTLAWKPADPDHVALLDVEDLATVHELVPAVAAPVLPALPVDPDADTMTHPPGLVRAPTSLWPLPFLDDGMEILRALTTVRAEVRVHLAPASDLEKQMLATMTRDSVQSRDPVAYSQYLGMPVRVRSFVGQVGGHLSPRLRAAIGRLGLGLVLVERPLSDPEVAAMWAGDEVLLAGAAQPFGVAQALVRIPAHGDEAMPCGIPTAEGETATVPLSSPASLTREGLRLGEAVSAEGSRFEVRLAPSDLILHTQVLGATGTGKSTLLAALAYEAAAAGMGVTVIEGHGTLVDRIVAELPQDALARTIAVRSDDLEHPVPVNVLRGPQGALMTDMMVQVLRELFDPRNEGFLGPRWERLFSQAITSQRLLFGDRANLAAAQHVFRSREQVQSLVRALRHVDAEFARTVESEVASLGEKEFADVSAWFNAKFPRMTNGVEMRAVLGTGEDTVDVTRVVDERGILLVDLATPTIGLLASQLLGEMWLAKHWAALAARRDPSQPHLLVVDEAHLFGSGLLPRLLAEARKFGVGVVLAHQHLEQLTPHLRDAALATTNNVIAFRSGPREAMSTLTRLGSWGGGPLTRLPRLSAAATLSQGMGQTDPFTLLVDHNERVDSRPSVAGRAAAVAAATASRYAVPSGAVEITPEVVDSRAAEVASASGGGSRPGSRRGAVRPSSGSSFLDEWLAKREAARPKTPDPDDVPPVDPDDVSPVVPDDPVDRVEPIDPQADEPVLDDDPPAPDGTWPHVGDEP